MSLLKDITLGAAEELLRLWGYQVRTNAESEESFRRTLSLLNERDHAALELHSERGAHAATTDLLAQVRAALESTREQVAIAANSLGHMHRERERDYSVVEMAFRWVRINVDGPALGNEQANEPLIEAVRRHPRYIARREGRFLSTRDVSALAESVPPAPARELAKRTSVSEATLEEVRIWGEVNTENTRRERARANHEQNEMGQLKADLESTSDELDAARLRVDSLRAENQKLKAELVKVSADRAQAVRETCDAEERLSAEIERLKAEIKRVTAERAGLQALIGEAAGALDDADGSGVYQELRERLWSEEESEEEPAPKTARSEREPNGKAVG
jgi:archaellum component FlaC